MTDSPAKKCQKPEWTENNGDNNSKKWQCEQKLYVEYVRAQAKTCKKVVIPISEGDVGFVPFKKIEYPQGYIPGPGEGCGRDIRCFVIDFSKKTALPCNPAEMKTLFPDADIGTAPPKPPGPGQA